MSNEILTASHIRKVFKSGDTELEVLRDVNLTVEKGEVVVIMGASGAGKSTLLHILGALDVPRAGTVAIDGQDLFTMNDVEQSKFRNQHIGFVFQFHHLLPEFTALENVAMPALIQGRTFAQARERALDLLEAVQLTQRAHHRPSELSGGEQQRVAVARALMNAPKLVLADEPSGNLDEEHGEELHELIFGLAREWKQTFVIVTHNPELGKRADSSYILHDGILSSDEEGSHSSENSLPTNNSLTFPN